MSFERYLELNGQYLREGEELLAAGNLTQASEKLWGAAAEMVKAVAAKRGRLLGTHASLWEFVTELHREKPADGLIDLFHIANSLHMNFYEGWLTRESVELGRQSVAALVQRLKSRL